MDKPSFSVYWITDVDSNWSTAPNFSPDFTGTVELNLVIWINSSFSSPGGTNVWFKPDLSAGFLVGGTINGFAGTGFGGADAAGSTCLAWYPNLLGFFFLAAASAAFLFFSSTLSL